MRFKKILLDVLGYLSYPFIKTKIRFDIMTSEETIDYIINNRCSISRYGDGEYAVMNNKFSGFQSCDPKLTERLIEVLNVPVANHLVCIPYTFKTLKLYKAKSRTPWRDFLLLNYKKVLSTTPKVRRYGNSLFTRFYIIMKDKSRSKTQLELIRRIWENRRVCIVEGEFSGFGEGNDLLDNCTIVSKILCPAKNAFEKYDDIIDAVRKNVDKDTLIICALGMTATVLAYDLSKEGYQALDMGHLDIEYEWMKMGVEEKCAIRDKSVNEVDANIPLTQSASKTSNNTITIVKG